MWVFGASHKVLEHLWILVSPGVLGPRPRGHRGAGGDRTCSVWRGPSARVDCEGTKMIFFNRFSPGFGGMKTTLWGPRFCHIHSLLSEACSRRNGDGETSIVVWGMAGLDLERGLHRSAGEPRMLGRAVGPPPGQVPVCRTQRENVSVRARARLRTR